MHQNTVLHQKSFIRRLCSAVLVCVFGFSVVLPPDVAQAQVFSPLNLPVPGVMISPTEGYIPALIKGIQVHPDNPLQFNFIIDIGDSGLAGNALREESLRLVKYFLASLTVPEDEMWVNLSPYEKGRIIPESFGRTVMGVDLLAEDYLLKQLTASLMYPEKELGQTFWNRVYARAREAYGDVDIPIDAFHKVWIVPKDAEVVQKDNYALIVNSSLEVLMEEDYFALRRAQSQGAPLTGVPGTSRPTELQTEVMREIIIPEITKEVNEGKNFARLRQIYNAMILAAWFKITLKESLLGKVYVDRNRVAGVDTSDSAFGQEIYDRYIEAFQKGVYNYIKEDEDPVTGRIIPRQYFSGGFSPKGRDGAMLTDRMRIWEGTATARQRAVWLRAAQPNAGGTQYNLGVDLLEDPDGAAALLQAKAPAGGTDTKEAVDFAMLSWPEVKAALRPGVNVAEFRSRYEKFRKIYNEIRQDRRALQQMVRWKSENTWNSPAIKKGVERLRANLSRKQEIMDQTWYVIEKNLDKNKRASARRRKSRRRMNRSSAELAFADSAMLTETDTSQSQSRAGFTQEELIGLMRQLYPHFPDITDKRLLEAVYGAVTSEDFVVSDVSLEAILAELEGDAQTSLGKGGLGYLAGETDGAYQNGLPVHLKYKRTKSGHVVDWQKETAEQPVSLLDKSGGESPLMLDVYLNGRRYETEVSWVSRNGTPVFLMYNEEICSELYPEPSDGHQRMLQYGFIAAAYVELMNRLGIHPEILRLNEAQLVFVQKAVENDIARKGEESVFWETRTVMTNHTPERAALPVFRQDRSWLEGLLGSDLVDEDMYRDHNGQATFENGRPVIRAAEVLARKSFVVTTVSEEHGEVTKRHVLPDFAWKTTYVQNGSDPKQWYSKALKARIAQKEGLDEITGEDLFQAGQIMKKELNHWLAEHGFRTFSDLNRPLFGAVRRVLEYKEQGIFLAMVRWVTGDPGTLYETPWGQQAGLGANFLVGGPISDSVGQDWAEMYRALENDESIKGKLVFIDETGTDIMGLSVSASDFWLESPRPTREASGTSHQRAMFNGTLPLASYTGGQLAVVEHGINGWLIDVFKTGGFTKAFDELADALDDPSHPRYAEMVERYRVGAQRLYGEYMTEAVGLYRRYQDGSGSDLLSMMEAAFRDSHEKVSIDRMMRDYMKLFGHVIDGTGAAGYESGQIPATRDAEHLQALLEDFAKSYDLTTEQMKRIEAFLMGRGPAVDVSNLISGLKVFRGMDADSVTTALWLTAAHGLHVSVLEVLVRFIITEQEAGLEGSVLSADGRFKGLLEDSADLRDVIFYERELRRIDKGLREGKDVLPELQHETRKRLRRAWESLEARREGPALKAEEDSSGESQRPLRALSNRVIPLNIFGVALPARADLGTLLELTFFGTQQWWVDYFAEPEPLPRHDPAIQEQISALNAEVTRLENEIVIMEVDRDAGLDRPGVWERKIAAHRETVQTHLDQIAQLREQEKAVLEQQGEVSKTGTDQAMLGTTGPGQDQVGGIDLNSAYLNLRIRRDGRGIPLPMNQQPMEELMDIPGFMPVIIQMTPVANLPLLLGLEKPVEQEEVKIGQLGYAKLD